MRILVWIMIGVLLCLNGEYVQAKKKKRKKPIVYVIDTFSDGSYQKSPEWWTFGDLMMRVSNNSEKKKYLGKKSLVVQGKASKWYMGGFGRYLGIDMWPFKFIKMVIYSPKPMSAMLEVQLFDDDNKNWKVDTFVNKEQASHDDIFVHNILMDWTGWKTVVIPLSQFDDDNPEEGDNIWNPYRIKGSGGLLQMQVIVSTAKQPTGDVTFKIDSLKFTQ